MALQAFIDDSIDEHVLTLGGLISPSERSEVFVREWGNALLMRSKIRWFKMSEAMGFGGEFDGMSCERRDERIKVLYRIAEDAALAFVAISIELKPYDEIFGGFQYLKNPYYSAIFGIAERLAATASEIGVHEKLTLVFDQRGESRRISDAWTQFKSLAPPNVQSLISDAPTFRDDTECLQLQASDMIAWWVRRKKLEQLGVSERMRPPWNKARDVPTLVFDWSEMNLLRSQARALGIPLPVLLKLRGSYISLNRP